MEGLVAFFTCLRLDLLVAIALEAILIYIELSDANAVEGKSNSFREFLMRFLLNVSLETACAW